MPVLQEGYAEDKKALCMARLQVAELSQLPEEYQSVG